MLALTLGNKRMNKWPHELISYSPGEVQKFCVNDEIWQTFRLSLKGISTVQKLLGLDRWLKFHGDRRGRVQVSNYINALKRGGQLNMDLEVQR